MKYNKLWEKLIVCFLLIRHMKYNKLWEKLIACFLLIRHMKYNKLWEKLIVCFLLIRHTKYNKLWEKLIASFLLIRHGKRRVQHLFYCCVCIRCHGNVFTEPLPSNDRVIHIQRHRLTGGIYGVRRWNGLRCHYIHTKFHRVWFFYSKVDDGHTDNMVIA
jgi:hypothetical protein